MPWIPYAAPFKDKYFNKHLKTFLYLQLQRIVIYLLLHFYVLIESLLSDIVLKINFQSSPSTRAVHLFLSQVSLLYSTSLSSNLCFCIRLFPLLIFCFWGLHILLVSLWHTTSGTQPQKIKHADLTTQRVADPSWHMTERRHVTSPSVYICFLSMTHSTSRTPSDNMIPCHSHHMGDIDNKHIGMSEHNSRL